MELKFLSLPYMVYCPINISIKQVITELQCIISLNKKIIMKRKAKMQS